MLIVLGLKEKIIILCNVIILEMGNRLCCNYHSDFFNISMK